MANEAKGTATKKAETTNKGETTNDPVINTVEKDEQSSNRYKPRVGIFLVDRDEITSSGLFHKLTLITEDDESIVCIVHRLRWETVKDISRNNVTLPVSEKELEGALLSGDKCFSGNGEKYVDGQVRVPVGRTFKGRIEFRRADVTQYIDAKGKPKFHTTDSDWIEIIAEQGESGLDKFQANLKALRNRKLVTDNAPIIGTISEQLEKSGYDLNENTLLAGFNVLTGNR